MEMVDSPAATAVMIPASVMVAASLFEEAYETVLSVALSGSTVNRPEMSRVCPSSTDLPSAISLSRVMDSTATVSAGFAFTVSVKVAVLSPAFTVISVSPSATAVMTPASETVAMSVLEDEYETVLSVAFSGRTVTYSEMSRVVPSVSS